MKLENLKAAFHYIETRALGPAPDLAPLVKACRADLAELPPDTDHVFALDQVVLGERAKKLLKMIEDHPGWCTLQITEAAQDVRAEFLRLGDARASAALDRLTAREADLKLAQAKIENLRAELEIERKGNRDLNLELERLPELQKELETEREYNKNANARLDELRAELEKEAKHSAGQGEPHLERLISAALPNLTRLELIDLAFTCLDSERKRLESSRAESI